MKNTYEYKTNKITLMSYIILISIILIILLTIFSFNIYATYNNESENQIVSTEFEGENVNNNKLIMKVILKVIEEDVDYIKNISVDVPNEAVEDESVLEQEEPEVGTYTASNGKTYETIADLNIPSLGINYPVLSSNSEELLNVSLNKYWGASPNKIGNMVILGHNYKDSRFFGKLINIQKGAIVQITDVGGRTLDYKVYETGVIDPYDTSCTSQLTDGHTEITLITCYYVNGSAHATKRFYVKARAY